MVVTPSSSLTRFGESESDRLLTAGSSFRIAADADVTVKPSMVDAPETIMVSSGSCVRSSTGVKVKVAVALAASAGMVSGKPVTGSKSSACAVPGATEIVSAVACGLGSPSSVAVTVISAAPEFSITEFGDTLRTAAVAGVRSSSSFSTSSSSSARVRVHGSGSARPPSVTVAPIVNVLSGSITSLSVARRRMKLLNSWPAGMVRVVPPGLRSPAAACACGVMLISRVTSRSMGS